MKKRKSYRLDPDEENLLSSIERGEWQSVKNLKKEKETARRMAANTLRQDVEVSVHLSSGDIKTIKQQAAYEGLPYELLISSVLHKFAAGHLIDERALQDH